MANKKDNGFDDFEDDFFNQGESGKAGWADEPVGPDPKEVERLRLEEEARRRAEDEARRRAEDEARRRAEEEARRRAEEEARRRAEEEARRRAEEEARRRAEDERRRQEEEARRQAEEARRQAEEARRQAEEARRRVEEEERKRREAEIAARAAAEEDAWFSEGAAVAPPLIPSIPAPPPPPPKPRITNPTPTIIAPIEELRRMALDESEDEEIEDDSAVAFAEDLVESPEEAVAESPAEDFGASVDLHPATAREPAAQEPEPEDRIADEPAVAESMDQAPAADEPVAESMDQAPVAEEPVAEEPVAEESMAADVPPTAPAEHEPAAPDSALAVRPSAITAEPGRPALEAMGEPDDLAVPAPSTNLVVGQRGGWEQAAQLLVTEGRGSGPAASRALALAEAARIARTRLGDSVGSETYAREAVELDGDSLSAQRELVEALNRNGNFEDLLGAMQRLAAMEPDANDAAETLRNAAMLAWGHLGRADEAVALCQAAIERNPEDFLSFRNLRDWQLLREDWWGVTDTLASMAVLSEGALAARLWCDRGRIFDGDLKQSAQATESYRNALAADPNCTAAFLELESLYTRTDEWTGLAQLYLDEATRLGGADASFWQARAARIYRTRLFDDERARTCYELALTGSGNPEVACELEAMLSAEGRWPEVAALMERELEWTDAASASFVNFRLGRIRELHLNDAAGALNAYREAAKDPAASPAAEAVARMLQSIGDYAELLNFWQARSEILEDPNLKVTLEYRMGEICEGPLNDQAGAQTHFEHILDIAPGYLPALEGLERVYSRRADWERLAAVYEQRAILNEEPAAIALQLHRAGSVFEMRLGDTGRAKDFYRRALDHVPDFPASLDAYLSILEGEGDFAGLAATLRSAAAATQDSNEQVSLLYRAARVLADKVSDSASAVDCLRQCLALSPGFLSAHYLLKELVASGRDWEALLELQTAEAASSEQAERKAWQMLAAADVASMVPGEQPEGYARQVLEFAPAHPGATALLERAFQVSGNTSGLVDLYVARAARAGDDTTRARVATILADLSRDLGDRLGAMQAAGDVIAADEAVGRPLIAIARICETLKYWEDAVRALSAAGQVRDVARLQEDYLDSLEAARDSYQALIAESPMDLGAAAALARVLRKLQDHAGLAEGYRSVAQLTSSVPEQVMNAALAGNRFAAVGREDEALAAYRSAFEARPTAGTAFDGIRQILVTRRDADGLRELYGRLPHPDELALASDLEEVGDISGAAAVLSSVQENLSTLVRLERALEEGENWRAAFEVLNQMSPLLTDPQNRAWSESRQRWMLAEKLAETDEAWDLYRQLHEQNPRDVQVLEALARIAAARGDSALGIKYLEQLAQNTASDEESARYCRRLGEIHERDGRPEEAQRAYLSALERLPEDREALAGLRRIAEAAGDWQGLVGVLSREANLSEGAEQGAVFGRIARIWQDEVGDSAAAADAWRQVLELTPDDNEALQRLVVLCEEARDWSGFVEYGQALARQLSGEARAALLRRVGLALLDYQRDEEGALRAFEAATTGDFIDLEAAQALERVRSGRSEWDLAVEAIRRQAKAMDDGDAAATLLRAAHIKLDTLAKRDDAAGLFREVMERDPNNEEALRFLADYVFKAGDHASAAVIFDRLEAKSSEWDLEDFDEKVEVSLLLFHFASSLAALNREDEALTKLERALDLNPTHLPSLMMAGPLYMKRKDWERAENVYRQMLQLTGGTGNNEQLARTYAALGRVEAALNKLDKARKRFQKALELKPNDVAGLQGLAMVCFALGEWSNVLTHYNNVIYHAKEPDAVVDAFLMKGFVLDAKMNLPEKAAQHYQKTLAFDPKQAEALLRLAELSLRRKDWADAISLSERALGLDHADPLWRAHVQTVRAIALRASGDNGAAANAFEEALVLAPSLSDALGTLGIESFDRVHEIIRDRLRESR